MKNHVILFFVLMINLFFSCQNEKILTNNQQPITTTKQDSDNKKSSDLETPNSTIGPAQSISKPTPPAPKNGERPKPQIN